MNVRTGIGGSSDKATPDHLDVGGSVLVVGEFHCTASGLRSRGDDGIEWYQRLASSDFVVLDVSDENADLAEMIGNLLARRRGGGTEPFDFDQRTDDERRGDLIVADGSGVVMTPAEVADVIGARTAPGIYTDEQTGGADYTGALDPAEEAAMAEHSADPVQYEDRDGGEHPFRQWIREHCPWFVIRPADAIGAELEQLGLDVDHLVLLFDYEVAQGDATRGAVLDDLGAILWEHGISEVDDAMVDAARARILLDDPPAPAEVEPALPLEGPLPFTADEIAAIYPQGLDRVPAWKVVDDAKVGALSLDYVLRLHATEAAGKARKTVLAGLAALAETLQP